MVFAHDTRASLASAVALVNSRYSVVRSTTLDTVADLDAFFVQHGYTGRHDSTEAEIDEVRSLLPRLRTMLTADRLGAVSLVNQALSEIDLVPQVRKHGTIDWHLHVIGDDRALAERILVETAMALVELIREDEMSRLGVCEDEACEGIVLDLSRNRSKRFCSIACGNRNAVAAYRARQSEN